MNFFVYEFPDRNPEFVLPVLLFVPQVIGQIIGIKWVNKIPIKCGITSMTIVKLVMAIILPILVNVLVSSGDSYLAWIITLFVMAFFSLYSAMVNALITGFIS